MSRILESQESSSPIITRSVARALNGISVNSYEFSTLQQIGMRLIGALPSKYAEWIIPRVNPSTALSMQDVEGLVTADLVQHRLRDYTDNPGPYPTVTIGVGMGGASAHLALALGGPFLPQAFVMTLKRGSKNGDVNQYFKHSADLARKITNRNPDLMTIQHYDPVHDGWLVKRVNHLRVKLLNLPEGYKTFIRSRLQKGGTVVYLEGGASWKRFRVGPRNIFQVGGWGDLSTDEFLNGSERLSNFAKREELITDHWCLTGFDMETGPESEWGSEAGLDLAIEQFCHENGYRFIKIRFDDPNDFSRLAFHAKWDLIQKAGLQAQGVVVEMFTQFDASTLQNTALLPLWLIFNTTDSLRFLESMTPIFPKEEPVFFSGLSTFSITPDLVPFEEWKRALSAFKVINCGARKSHYPADVNALLDWSKPLHEYESNHKKVEFPIMSAEALSILADKILNHKIEM